MKFNAPGLQVDAGFGHIAILIGKFAFYSLVVLIALSLFKGIAKIKLNLPYHIWRQTHRLIGLVFIAVTIHQFFVRAPFDNNSALSYYLNTIGVIGAATYLWTQIRPFLNRRKFKVVGLTKHPAATIIDLQPVGKSVSARPGQFAFVSFAVPGLREPHPFTLSRIGENGELQFSIRGLGDFTKKLRDRLNVGDMARLEPAHGWFDFNKGGNRQVWVAAGIGITPFLAWADSLRGELAREIELVYCVRNEAEAIGIERLQAAQERAPGFRFNLYRSEQDGRFTAEVLKKIVPFDLPSASLWYCGPAPLRKALAKDLKTMGAAPRSFHFERFEFR